MNPTRRTVVRGAAWTAPAIVVAAAAPAMAASPPSVITATNDGAIQVDGPVLRFASSVRNTGTGPSTNMMAMVQVTAPSAASWGAAPTAVLTNFLSGQSQTAARWTFVSVSGTGDTRTFLFDAITEFAPSTSNFFDYEIRTDGGAIGPGTLVRTFDPGGGDPVAVLTSSYGAAARSSGPSNRRG